MTCALNKVENTLGTQPKDNLTLSKDNLTVVWPKLKVGCAHRECLQVANSLESQQEGSPEQKEQRGGCL